MTIIEEESPKDERDCRVHSIDSRMDLNTSLIGAKAGPSAEIQRLIKTSGMTESIGSNYF
jgi:hypothetical protein